MTTEEQLKKEKLEQLRNNIQNDPVKLIETIFRIRTVGGQLVDYTVAEPHKEILRNGILGNKTVQFEVINKGRQAGFSTLSAVEALTVAQYFPLTFQYYIATKEKQAKSWLKKVERIAKDSRLNFDGSRIIDIDTRASNELQKVIRHGDKLEESYICGLAASPGGVRGDTSVKITLDEFAWMIWRKDLQKQVYESVKYFISTGGFMTVQSTPCVQTDMFWDMYSTPEKFMMKAYYCPVIENYEEIDLNRDLREQELVIPYWWIDVNVLEKARRDDLDFFKQEVLGIPVDAAHRFITPELVYANIMNEDEIVMSNKPGPCKMAIDVAQARDITAITIGTKIGEIVYEKEISESSEEYPEQFKLIERLVYKYQPNEIGIDNTGIGRSLGDMIKAGLPVQLTRFEFASKVEVVQNKKESFPAHIAGEFKKALVDEKYKMLDHRAAISHILRVEKIVTETGGIRFSGKATGRDDHFFSKAMLNIMFLGKIGRTPDAFAVLGDVHNIGNRPLGQRRSPVEIGEAFAGRHLHW